MSTLGVLLTVFGSIAGLVLLLLLVGRWVRSMLAAARRKLDSVAAGRVPLRVHERVNFFGVQSASAMQARGNGVLGLYETEIVFVQVMIDRVIRIPLSSITAVAIAKSFLGKTIFRDLLTVTWSHAGIEDCAAWYVGDAQVWIHAIDEARSASGARVSS